MNKTVLKYLKIWVFPVFFVILVLAAFVAWGERQMRVPGGFYDVRFLEQTLSSAQKTGDLVLLSDYFIHRTAEVLAFSSRDPEALLLYEFINHVLLEADLERNISDLKYAVAVYKKQLLISTPAMLRIYLSLCESLHFFQSFNLGSELVTDSEIRVKALREIRSKDPAKEELAAYESLVTQADFFKLRSWIMLKLAYFNYEVNPAVADKWIDQARRADPPSAVHFALNYLDKKIKTKKRMGKRDFSRDEFEVRLLKAIKLGLFSFAKKGLESDKDRAGAGSLQLREVETWLGVEPQLADKEKLPFFSVYFQALRRYGQNPVELADKLAGLATDRDWAVYSSFLRYQAWGVAFFDARDFSRAVLFKDFLKTYDPLSLFSQLESMGGTFKFALKEYKGEELERMWEHMPTLFNKKNTIDEWGGFKSRKKRVAQTIVYEGQVFVLNYDAAGVAQRLQIVGMNQVSSERKPAVTVSAPEKMGWIDQFFYDFMMQFIPDGVKAFKDQIAGLSSRRKEPVFTRVYTEFEFREYIIKTLESKYGGVAKGIQVKIDEQGFSLYAVFDLKVLTVPASGLGKLIVADGDSGELILKLDHVKVSGLSLPDWVLRKVEKNFNLTASMGYENSGQGLQILDMQYQAGGVQIKCRNPVNRIYGNAGMAA